MPSPSSDNQPVIVVGGGMSGLACAVDLSSRNIPVLLLEQTPKLGGRAYSFSDAETGDVIDNGQHVLIAGYEHTMRFLDRIGTRQYLAVQHRPTLVFHHPERGICEFKLPALPAPLHLAAGILATDLFSFRDKLYLLRAGMKITGGRHEAGAQTIEEWLNAAGQSEETKRSFWEPLAIAIMNEHIAAASASVFIESIRRAFLQKRSHAAMAIPRVGLSELYVNDARRFIEQRKGTIRCNADAVGLIEEGDLAVGVRLRNGTMMDASAVVLAVPHYRVPSISPGLFDSAAQMAQQSSTPIVSIHLWFEHDFMPQEFVGLIDRRIQWVFNKRLINKERQQGGHVSCVISGAGAFVDLTSEELCTIALEDLRSAYPDAPSSVKHSVVIREKRATFSCSPEVVSLRPGAATRLSNTFLAGDWTNTGLPATIEGAIISGERAAEAVCRFIGAV